MPEFGAYIADDNNPIYEKVDIKLIIS